MAPGSGESGDDDPGLEAEAYNQNIYLMVAAPYVLLSALGTAIYRDMRKVHRADLATLAATDSHSGTPPPSVDPA